MAVRLDRCSFANGGYPAAPPDMASEGHCRMAALTRGSHASSTCAHVHPPKDMPVTAQLVASSRPAKRLSAPAASAPILSSSK